MRTTLRGGTNDITGVSTVSATSLSATGSISSGGNISATGDFTAANITATGTARGATVAATGNMSVAQDLAVASTLTANDARVVTETYAGGWFRSTGAKGWYSEKWGGGWYMSDSTWIRAFNDKSIYTGGEYKSLDQVSWTRTKAGEFVDLLNVNSRNAACASNGLVSREWDGGILYCKSGIWRSTSEVGDYVFLAHSSDQYLDRPATMHLLLLLLAAIVGIKQLTFKALLTEFKLPTSITMPQVTRVVLQSHLWFQHIRAGKLYLIQMVAQPVHSQHGNLIYEAVYAYSATRFHAT